MNILVNNHIYILYILYIIILPLDFPVAESTELTSGKPNILHNAWANIGDNILPLILLNIKILLI